jgi:hypothetical protein
MEHELVLLTETEKMISRWYIISHSRFNFLRSVNIGTDVTQIIREDLFGPKQEGTGVGVYKLGSKGA